MKLLSEGIKRHMGHNTFSIWLIANYIMILGVQWMLIVTNNTNNDAFKQKQK